MTQSGDLRPRETATRPSTNAEPRWQNDPIKGIILLLGASISAGTHLVLGARAWISVLACGIGALVAFAWAAHVLMALRDPTSVVRADSRGPKRQRSLPVHLVFGGLAFLLTVALGVQFYVAYLSLGAVDPSIYSATLRAYAVLGFTAFALGLLGPTRVARALASAADHHGRMMVVSFGLTALIGAFLLVQPAALRDVRNASFVDGLFTAVSAVCVTGLSVNVVPETYTAFGQAVILALIQVGGIGMMVLYAFFAVLAGRRMQVRQAVVMAEMMDVQSLANLRRTLAGIVGFTLVCEALGAAALYQAFAAHPTVALGPGQSLADQRLWAALFHSVSAFCNAGFSVFKEGTVPFVASWPVAIVLCTLVVLGGVGYPVAAEVMRRAVLRVRGERPARLSLHARVVIVTSCMLLVAGTLLFLVLEWQRTLHDLPLHARVLAAVYQSVMTRTAGFNTLDFSAMGPATLLATCVLMFIGGSPGSTAGGIKTTTLAVLFATFRSELRGRVEPQLFGRALSAGTVRRAMGVAFVSLALLTLTAFLLTLFEEREPFMLLFEVVSALATVGLTAGASAGLSSAGKLLIIACMFIGRIGPLTLALALAETRPSANVRYPEERVGLG